MLDNCAPKLHRNQIVSFTNIPSIRNVLNQKNFVFFFNGKKRRYIKCDKCNIFINHYFYFYFNMSILNMNKFHEN